MKLLARVLVWLAYVVGLTLVVVGGIFIVALFTTYAGPGTFFALLMVGIGTMLFFIMGGTSEARDLEDWLRETTSKPHHLDPGPPDEEGSAALRRTDRCCDSGVCRDPYGVGEHQF